MYSYLCPIYPDFLESKLIKILLEPNTIIDITFNFNLPQISFGARNSKSIKFFIDCCCVMIWLRNLYLEKNSITTLMFKMFKQR